MNLLLDGLTVLIAQFSGIFLFLVSAFGIGYGIREFLTAGNELPRWVRLVESILLGTLLLGCYSLALVILEQLWTPIFFIGSSLVPIASAIPLILTARNKGIKRLSAPDAAMGGIYICSFVLFLLTRLAFLKSILLPLDTDSPNHYKIVQGFLTPRVGNITLHSLVKSAAHFYHVGFHSLAAVFAVIAHTDPATSIAVLGQILISLSPFSLLWLIYAITHNGRAAWVTGLFAGLVWQMPYFAVNWGKYPAIAGLSLAPAVLGFWVVYGREVRKHWPHILILTLLTITLGLLHTRLFICLALAGGIYFIVQRFFRGHIFSLWEKAFLWLLGLAAFIPFQESLISYYSINQWIGIVTIALFMFFAFQTFPHLSMGLTLFLFGVWAASQISIRRHLVLLDQPFIDTMLFIPISVFIGIGFAGISEKLASKDLLQPLLAIAIGGVVLTGIYASRTFYPDACCNYVKPADMSAINWIRTNTSQKAVVMAAGFRSGNYMIGTDAGMWVSELTGRNTNQLIFNFNWSSTTAIGKVCKPRYPEVYIYKGGMANSFDEIQLDKQTWIQTDFASNGIIVYHVLCNQGSRVP